MSMEFKLELGHKAQLRDKPTTEGFTHNWTVFLKGNDGSNIYHFVDKVIFHLHESFNKPRRVVKEPPYQISELGYAGFMMPIEVHFRSKEEPKKVRFEYDLYLRCDVQPVHNIRVEKLTFQNPSDDFRRKLLKARSDRLSAGGGGVGLPSLAVAPLQRSEEAHPPTHTKPVAAIAEKKPRSHTPVKEPSKPAVPAPKPPSQPFNDIFGSPIKPKHSPEQANKSKENAHSNHQKQGKYVPTAAVAGVVASKDAKQTAKDSHSGEVKEAKTKVPKSEKESKPGSKRLHTSTDTQHADKKKKQTSSSSSGGKPADGSKIREEKGKRDKHKVKSSLSGKKDKHRSSQGSQHKESGKSPKLNNRLKLGLPDVHSTNSSDDKAEVLEFKADPGDPTSAEPPTTPEDAYHPGSPLPRDMDTDLISPLSSEDESPQSAKEILQPSNHKSDSNQGTQDGTKANSLKPKSSSKPKMSKRHQARQNGTSSHDGPARQRQPPPMEDELDYHQQLVSMQRRIMALNDHRQLQNIVDIIERTGRYHVSARSFDFDLCRLDTETVLRLRYCLGLL